uniref:Even-skipped homeobox 1 n=1 Tax=Loxodonta africana TaxID=9785 RepID=G3UF05_LOXAF
MESRKDMVMFLDGGQLGTLVGKRVSNLSEAVGSPLPEPPEKMVPRSCLEEESVDGLGGEPRAAGAAVLGPGPPAPSADSLSGQGQPSSSDTESDFYEEIEVSCTPDCATGNAEYQHSKGSGSDALAGSPNGSGGEASKSGTGLLGFGPLGQVQGQISSAPPSADFTCASTSRSDSFLTFAPSVLSKASSVALDQREEVPLTR